MNWIATYIVLWGLLYSAWKKPKCWILWLVGDILWIAWGIPNHQWAIVFQNVVFTFMNLYGIYCWKPEGEVKTEYVYLSGSDNEASDETNVSSEYPSGQTVGEEGDPG
jgi:nicotinamide riboside transporter PnuC